MAARGEPTEALDAWGACHLGMSHLHRFNAHDNAIALGLFERANALDPDFALAFAARAFARFQDGSQWFRRDRTLIVADVRRLAERAVELDPLDPFVNMAMGRSHWLTGRPDDGLDWYERAIALSPSYSKGHYTKAMTDAFAGRSDTARAGVDVALHLGPLDPLMGPMLAARCLAYVVEGNHPAARDWGLRAARRAPTHSTVVVATVAACQLAGDQARAAHWAGVLHGIVPDIASTIYLQMVPLAGEEVHARGRAALRGGAFRNETGRGGSQGPMPPRLGLPPIRSHFPVGGATAFGRAPTHQVRGIATAPEKAPQVGAGASLPPLWGRDGVGGLAQRR